MDIGTSHFKIGMGKEKMGWLTLLHINCVVVSYISTRRRVFLKRVCFIGWLFILAGLLFISVGVAAPFRGIIGVNGREEAADPVPTITTQVLVYGGSVENWPVESHGGWQVNVDSTDPTNDWQTMDEGSELHLSTNAGVSWANTTESPLLSGKWHVFETKDGNFLIARLNGTAIEFHRSVDGVTYTLRLTDDPGTAHARAGMVFEQHAVTDRIWANASGKVWYSDDDGVSWIDSGGRNCYGARKIALSGDQILIGDTTSTPCKGISGSDPVILTSLNNGVTWTSSACTDCATTPEQYAMPVLVGGECFIYVDDFTSSAILRGNAAGTSWSKITRPNTIPSGGQPPAESYVVFGLSTNRANYLYFLGENTTGDPYRLWYTATTTISWTDITGDMTNMSVGIGFNATDIFVTGDGKLRFFVKSQNDTGSNDRTYLFLVSPAG